jgi:hypothetical protein
MAERARRITAESLGERLPVEHAEDEFGRLASVSDGFVDRSDVVGRAAAARLLSLVLE